MAGTGLPRRGAGPLARSVRSGVEFLHLFLRGKLPSLGRGHSVAFVEILAAPKQEMGAVNRPSHAVNVSLERLLALRTHAKRGNENHNQNPRTYPIRHSYY
jgi:hypothetical protein